MLSQLPYNLPCLLCLQVDHGVLEYLVLPAQIAMHHGLIQTSLEILYGSSSPDLRGGLQVPWVQLVRQFPAINIIMIDYNSMDNSIISRDTTIGKDDSADSLTNGVYGNLQAPSSALAALGTLGPSGF